MGNLYGVRKLLLLNTNLLFAYGAIGIFLLVRAAYLDEQLKQHVDKKYPEEGENIRSYEWQMYPRSVGQKHLIGLIKQHSDTDPELAHRAQKVRHSIIYSFTWFIVFLLVFASFVIYYSLTPAK